MKKSPPREYNCDAQLPSYPRRTFILCHLRTTKCRVCRTPNGIANTISCSPRSTGGRRFTPSFAPTSGNTSGDAACTKASTSSRRTRCPITYTCLCAYPEALRLELHGVPERQDEPHDIRRAREPEIQLRGQALLVRGVLRQHRRAEQEDGSELHQEPGARGPDRGSSKPEGVQGPVHG